MILDRGRRIITTVFLYIHRGFFAACLLHHSEDPLKSPYSHSYVTAFYCSKAVVELVKRHFDLCPDLMSRFWTTWTNIFSAAVSGMWELSEHSTN